jgi:homoserine O-acetyltransferase
MFKRSLTVSVQRCLLPLALMGALACHQPSLLHPESAAFRRPAPAVFHVRLHTTKGDIDLEVKREWSPHGADRFYQLVRHHYFDSAAVFRIRKGTWAQFGIAADPAIARAWRGQMIPDDPRVLSNTRGTVAYAFKDPNGRSTQLFINLRDNSSTHDNEPFVPFARVTAGMEVADSLYAGYGERAGGGIRGGKQDSLFAEGNSWLLRNFPGIDYILRASIIDDRH